ncbi:hypothetical protein Mchl_1973 [Methylorubrum extorquens CM4]|uniref:Uncharacterized protein n=1 Tax=Methylorubrum extorquens (strain CM4 / NCIMB 13688) TaxID=440085 RepID=B7KW08_METC4|nr:hypothetical protein Mchl_1973 [Methylorubrum extorquens CM4]
MVLKPESGKVQERGAGFATEHDANNTAAVVGPENQRGVWAGSGDFFVHRFGGGQLSQCAQQILKLPLLPHPSLGGRSLY